MLRFKDINILPKQLGVMGVVLALLVLNILFGYLGIARVSRGLEVFSRWSNIDMVMNEAVTQNLLLTVGAVNNYSALPTAEQYARFEQALETARNGLEEWKQTLAGHDDILREAEGLAPLFGQVESSMRAMKTLEENRKSMVQESDRLAEELADLLHEVMEETIDPAKERAERRADIRQMVRWGAIDMVMNEAVIAPTLRLVTATHDCAGGLSETSFAQARMRLEQAAEGLAEWSELIRGEPALEKAARFAGDVFQTLGDNIARLETISQDRTRGRQELDRVVGTVLGKLTEVMEEVIDPAKEQAVTGAMDAKGATVRTLMGLGAASLVLGAALAAFLAWSIANAIKKTMRFAQAVDQGDMDRTLDVVQGDECGALADALRSMVRALKDKIAEANDQSSLAQEETAKAQQAMAEADEARAQAERARCEGMAHAADSLDVIVQRVASAVQAISDHAQGIRDGAEAQTDRLQSTASAMEEMNATVLEVARNASDAAQGADNAKDRAQHGAGIMDNVIQATQDVSRHTEDMKSATAQLGEQVESIGAILGIISDIADQTNLLALNAAIEAARAGDAGRGFAVVADEVRKLAEKTMQATQEVGTAITGIQDRTRENIQTMDVSSEAVGRSTALTVEAGGVLEDIVQGAETSADRIQSIATAAEEQSATSEEINRSVEDINRIAAETSQGVAETTAALQDLSSQMQEMENLIRELKEECVD